MGLPRIESCETAVDYIRVTYLGVTAMQEGARRGDDYDYELMKGEQLALR